jgi:hypothetical protein
MRRITAGLALAFCLHGGGSVGDFVPLATDERINAFGMCYFLYRVVDVVADPISGEPILKGTKGTNYSVTWPRGFSARRAGSEVEVLDTSGTVVLTTGARYSICPSDFVHGDGWVVGGVKPVS